VTSESRRDIHPLTIRSYKQKRSIDEVDPEDENLDVPALPPTHLPEVWNCITTVRALEDRDPTKFSDSTIQTFHSTMKNVDVTLQKAHLTTIEHGNLQAKLLAEHKRKTSSRRSIQKGGASASADELRAKIKARNEKEGKEACPSNKSC
jgi:hypothetical protein